MSYSSPANHGKSTVCVVRECMMSSIPRDGGFITLRAQSFVPVNLKFDVLYPIHRTWIDSRRHLQIEILVDKDGYPGKLAKNGELSAFTDLYTAVAYFLPGYEVKYIIVRDRTGQDTQPIQAYIFADERDFHDWSVRSAL